MNEFSRRLNTMRKIYERERNPLYLWWVYWDCRTAGEEIPDWVLEYLDRVAENLLFQPAPDEVAPFVAVALEMKAPGKSGRGNVFKDSQDTSDVRMAYDVECYLKDGHKRGLAVEYVAGKYNVSESTVARAVKKYLPTLLSSKK